MICVSFVSFVVVLSSRSNFLLKIYAVSLLITYSFIVCVSNVPVKDNSMFIRQGSRHTCISVAMISNLNAHLLMQPLH